MWKWLNDIRYKRGQVNTVKRGVSYNGGVVVNEDSAMQVSAFYRGLIYISTQISKLPWEIKDRSNQILEGTLTGILNVAPNPEMNAMSFRLCMTQSAIIHGNSYAEIERDGIGRPVALWPIPSNHVGLDRAPDGSLVYRIIGGSSYSPGEDVFLPISDVFHLKNFHTKDGLVGQGVVAYASEILGISLGADRMAGNLFSNGGLPSGVLEVPGALSDEAYERIKASWKENHSGRKAGGVAILEEGTKFHATTMSPDVLQFLESRQFNVLEIARFLGLPPTKLYDVTAATYSNQEQSNLEVATDTLDAWARAYESEADVKLLNRQYGGKRTEMDLYAVFRGDMTTRANYFSKMMQVSSISPNEIRKREGLAPFSGGDRYFIAVNNYSPLDRIDEIVDSQIDKAEKSGSSSDPTDLSPDQNVKSNAEDPLVQATIRFLEGK